MPPLNLTPAQLNQIVVAVGDAMSRGQVPGLGSAQNDTYTASDNVDGSHPLNIRYVIPASMQRLISTRLSFHLAPFRSYETVAAGTLHTHTWVQAGQNAAPAPTFSIGTNNAGNPINGPGNSAPYGFLSATESPAGAAAFSAFTAIDANGSGHTHPLTYGVFEGATATSVSIKFDGVDKTSALGGPFSADVVELDVRQFISVTQNVYHTISLQPSGLGRIEAHLKLGMYVNAQVP